MSFPAPVFMDLAEKVRTEVPEDTDVDTTQLGGVLAELAGSCRESIVRRGFIYSDDHPDGIVYKAFSWKVKSVLPDTLQNDTVVRVVIKVGAWAARQPEIWNQIYPKVVEDA
jgi:hypothetical protein